MAKKVLVVSTSLRGNSNSEILAKECERGAKKGLDFLGFYGLILKFADTDAVEDTVHGEDSFLA